MTEFSVSDLFMPLAVEPASQVGIFNDGNDESKSTDSINRSDNLPDSHFNIDSSNFTSDFPLDTISGEDWKLLDSGSGCFDSVNIFNDNGNNNNNNGTMSNQPIELNSSVVDAFFSSSDDTTPMFESSQQEQQQGQLSSLSTDWTPLFDSTAPVVTNADVISAGESMLTFVTENNSTSRQAQPNLVPLLENGHSNKCKTTNRVCKPSSTTTTTTSEQLDRLGVIPYKRKVRTQPLLPIVPASNDPAAIKRAKNTEAARRSRARKLKRMTQLEEKVESLLSEKCALEREVCRLKELLRANDVKF